MAKINEVTIDVSARLTVSDEIADRCLRLLEWWQNDHPEQILIGDTAADGSLRLERKKKHDPAASD